MTIKLYVGNLPFDVTETELGEIFGRIGPVESARIVTDRETGRARGFGFVEMADADAQKAIADLNGQNFGGRALTVNEARPREEGGNRGGGGGRGGYNSGGGGGGYNRNRY